jgi:pimeloyl-ACP methyl ester carboxylesterase
LVKVGTEPQGVLFICPGTWSSGEQLISNPLGDPWTKYENYTEAIYWANRGFDVYSIDYRTHFVPIYLTASQLSFMANWSWNQWISDIKEAVDMAKEVSGAKRIYMAGESFGGSAAMNYASLYWEEDLKGIILLDGGPGGKRGGQTGTYNLTAAINLMIATGKWATEVHSSPALPTGGIYLFQYADKYPGGLSPVPGFPNASAWAAYAIYWAWGPGGVSNIYGGYGKASVMIHICATFDRYWPTRLSLESAAISDWNSCPYVTYDFDDHYSEIDVPLLGFTSGLFGLPYMGPFIHGIANPDFTGIYLSGYGHLDVYSGEYSERDVSAPTYEWMFTHRMLIGYGGICTDSGWNWEKTTIYINATVIDFKVNGVRVSWNIIYHWVYSYWFYRWEIYVGQSELGWIYIFIGSTGYSWAIGPRVFFFGQRV